MASNTNEELKTILNCLLSLFTERQRQITTPFEEKSYIHRIHDFRKMFDHFYELKTPRPALSSHYHCVGRLKFYGDKFLFLYMEVSEKSCQASLWPVRVTWKVELIDEADDENKERIFLIGETFHDFSKPRQGFSSHANDWLCIDLERVEKSGSIARDGSVTMRWTVQVQPLIQIKVADDFENLLKKIHDLSNSYRDPETVLAGIETMLEGLVTTASTQEDAIKRLCHKMSDVDSQLKTLELNHERQEKTLEILKEKILPG